MNDTDQYFGILWEKLSEMVKKKLKKIKFWNSLGEINWNSKKKKKIKENKIEQNALYTFRF